MSPKLDKALNRLTSILPLKERQRECGSQIGELHRRVLRSFVEQGRILSREEMGRFVDHIDDAARTLADKDMVVFSADGTPLGAYPFTMEKREHMVEINGHRVYAMCALDALSVAPMFGMDTHVRSRCRVTGEPVEVRQSGKTIRNLREAEDLHFGIIWGAANGKSSCASTLCLEMMFLKNGSIARQWLAENPDNREVFKLDEAVEFGDRFFSPLLARPPGGDH
jgi:hypothetical protein